MSKNKLYLDADEIDRILLSVFGTRPKGGGGRVGRWEAMRSLLRFILQQPRQTALERQIIYDWGIREGLTPRKAKEMLEDLSLMVMPDNRPVIVIEGTNSKIIKFALSKPKEEEEK